VSDYTLTIAVTGKPLPPRPASQDALLPGTRYHASAHIQCVAMPYSDPEPKPCDAFVIRRSGEGAATVEIPMDATHKRRILFVGGKPVASDSCEKMTVARRGDTTIVKFEFGEVYEIPDALVFGG
jgi:hypothetical protein